MNKELESLIASLEKKVSNLSGNMAEVEGHTRSTIQTAHHAFGGHISKGLLKRGRSALEKKNTAFVKFARTKVMLDLAKLARFGSPHKVGCDTTKFWDGLVEIVSRLHLLKDMGDSTDYYMADRDESLYSKAEVVKSFIKRYAGKREQKLSDILFAKPQ